MKRIAITGGRGVIGTVLANGLRDHDITVLHRPECDPKRFDDLIREFPGHDAVIHLAWDTKIEHGLDRLSESGKISPDNSLMTYNVYEAAIACQVPRVIMASSVHADRYCRWNRPELMSPHRLPEPNDPYGASKDFMEALGRYYAEKGLEVICIRFGGVNQEDKPIRDDPIYMAVWFSHRDCVSLVRACIEASSIPNNYAIIYGISNNRTRFHDYSNPFGWKPQDDSSAVDDLL
jgi:uronate dehydrogenase